MTVLYAERVDIDSVPMSTPAWRIVDLWPLLSSADKRGQDRLIPGAAGVRAKPRRRTVSVRALPMLITGTVDQDGAPYADVRAGFHANVAYLEAAIVEPPATAAGTRTATLHLPGGATRTGPVHVLTLEYSDIGSHEWAAAVLTISIPAGRLA